MANWLASTESVIISIPEAINEDNITFYELQIKIEDIEWSVKRRFREFVELHDKIVEHGVDKDSLPHKKLIGNKDPSFIMKRRRELESYLQSVFRFLQHSLPQELAIFLHLSNYDRHYILRKMASQQYDCIASEIVRDDIELTPLELFSLSQRLRTPCPPQEISEEKRYDFTIVADFVCGLNSLKIKGGSEVVGTSNIILNDLNFDLVAFKSLTKLVLVDINCCPERIESLGLTRKTLKHLEASKCGLKSIADMLLCDTHHMDKGRLKIVLTSTTNI